MMVGRHNSACKHVFLVVTAVVLALPSVLFCLGAGPTASPSAKTDNKPLVAPEKIRLDGTLYSKKGIWHLFVESDRSEFKKGSVHLVFSADTVKTFEKYLIQRSHVSIQGETVTSAPGSISVAVTSIAPVFYDPLATKSIRTN